MRQPGIYVLENTTTGKLYVGQSVDIDKRRQEHFNSMQKGKHHNVYIQQDYNMGHDFTFGVLEYCDLASLNQQEKYWINRLNTYHNGYNLTAGGGKTFVLVQETQYDEHHDQEMEKIYLKRFENELNAYNKYYNIVKFLMNPLFLLGVIVLAIICCLSKSYGYLFFIGIIIIYLIPFFILYICIIGYNQCVDKLEEHGHQNEKLNSPLLSIFQQHIDTIKIKFSSKK